MSLKRITAYNVGYGDCILLHFENEQKIGEKYFLLVDFGIRKSTKREQFLKILTSYKSNKRESRSKHQKELKELVGQQIAEIVDHSNMDILISHYHEDHYNGIYKASAFKNIEIQKVFVSMKGMPKELNKFIEERKLKIVYLQKINNYHIHKYLNGYCESINVLWPNKVFDSLSSRETFLSEQFPNWIPINNVKPSPGIIGKHDTCLVFEVKGVNNKWCLFPGDANDKFEPYITNSELWKNTNSFCYSFPSLPNKYSFIKAPHHGIESWPLAATASDCEVLITMADSHDKTFISKEYFNSQSIKKIHMMNCSKCDGVKYGSCSRCTMATYNPIAHIEINL